MVLHYFGKYRYTRLPFRAASTGHMFQKKIDELFSSMQKVFGIADDILIAGFSKQGRDHNKTLDKVLWICRQENLKLNKDKCLFACTSIPFFAKVISRKGVSQVKGKLKHSQICCHKIEKRTAVISRYVKLPN